jgi:hypothetical protein
LASSRAAKLFPALSFEDTLSTVRTNKVVPPGTVTARAAQGVTKTQIRLKIKTVGCLVIFWELGVKVKLLGLEQIGLSAKLRTDLSVNTLYLVVHVDGKHNLLT